MPNNCPTTVNEAQVQILVFSSIGEGDEMQVVHTKHSLLSRKKRGKCFLWKEPRESQLLRWDSANFFPLAISKQLILY